MDFAEIGAGVSLGIAWVAALLATGYIWGCRLDPKAPPRSRGVAAIVGGAWLAAALFVSLSAVGAFDRLGVSSALGLGLAASARRGLADVARCFARDRIAASTAWSELVGARRWRSPWLGAVAIVGGTLGFRFVRAMLEPPTATDALTYHLFRAGRFVQRGGWVVEPTPDAGGYYAYYPPLGDGFWAWTLLPVHSDALIAATAAGIVVAIAFGFYAAARALGAARRPAAWGALAVLATPAVSAWSSVAYVDGMLLATWLLAVASLPRAIALPRPSTVVWPMAALGLAVGIKTPGAVPFAIGAAVLAVAVAWRSSRPMRTFAAGFVAALVATPGLVLGLVDHGNPLYPFGVSALGWRANPEVEALQRGEFLPEAMRSFDLVEFLQGLFIPVAAPDVQHLNFGPAVLLVLPFVAALRHPWRGHVGKRWTAVVAGLVALVFVAQLTSDGTLGLRTEAAPAIGRFLTIVFVVLVLAAACSSSRLLVPSFAIMIVVGSWLGLPRGLGPVDAEAFAVSGPVVLGFFVASLLALVGVRAGRISAAKAGVGVLAILVICTTVLARRRPDFRDRYYQQLHQGELFDPHPTDPKATDAWPIWRWTESAPDGLRIAFAAGWDGMGAHWYRTPLLGSRLQHDVLYVSPTASGELIDYRLAEPLRAAASYDAWVRRLVEAEIDVVVLGVPQSVEHAWVLGDPARFVPVAYGEKRWVIAFALRAGVR